MPVTITKITSVIISTNPDSYLVTCGTCGGDGRYNGTCHVCKGIGKILLQIPSDWNGRDVGLVKCGTCNGEGRYNGTCHVCKGVGVLVKCFPRIICGTCGGDGRYNGTCNVCGGVGSVFIENLIHY